MDDIRPTYRIVNRTCYNESVFPVPQYVTRTVDPIGVEHELWTDIPYYFHPGQDYLEQVHRIIKKHKFESNPPPDVVVHEE